MKRTLSGGWQRAGAGLCLSFVAAGCTPPKLRELDASQIQTMLGDGDLVSEDASEPEDDAGERPDAAQESPEQRMQSMVGRYFMQLFLRSDDPSKPLITGLSLMEITLGADGLQMREKPCYYDGSSKINGFEAVTHFDASETPETTFELFLEDDSFQSDRPPVALGYDVEVPPGCASSPSLATKIEEKPWLFGQNCECLTDSAAALPESSRDCRINDDDHNGDPGVTLMAEISGYDSVKMFVAQRSRDHYVNMRFKDAQRNVLVSYFETMRVVSLLGCDPPGLFNCILSSAASCPAQYSRAEFVRVSLDESWTCARIEQVAALEDWFHEQVPQSCVN